jgi:deoxyribodipyrimidine photo-lyase
VRQWAPEHFGEEPPEPIVDLGETRKAALTAYEAVKRAPRN